MSENLSLEKTGVEISQISPYLIAKQPIIYKSFIQEMKV